MWHFHYTTSQRKKQPFSEKTQAGASQKNEAANGHLGCSFQMYYSADASRMKFLKNSRPSFIQATGMRSLVPWQHIISAASARNGP